MLRTADFTDQEVNLRAFMQVRALCLLALIFVHCFSYSTIFYRQKLDNLYVAIPLLLLALLNSLFVFLTGVTLRLQLGEKIQGNRLGAGSFWSVFDPLLLLVVIETLKNLYLSENLLALLQWDFLRTILVAFVLCYWISRVHIFLNFFIVGLLGCFFSDVQRWIRSYFWVPDFQLEVPGYPNFYHGIIFFLLVAILGRALVGIWRKSWPRVLKLLATSGLSLATLPLAISVLQKNPSLGEYALAKNWLLMGISGDPDDFTLMPVMAWGLSFLTGFAGAHLVIMQRDFFSRFRAGLVALVNLSLYVLGFVGCMLYLPQFLFKNYATWIHTSQSQTSLTAEILKICYFLIFFAGLVAFNAKYNMERLSEVCTKMGRASFWIYLIATSFTPWISGRLVAFSHSLPISIAVTLALTLAGAWLLAELVHFIGSKRLRLKLKRVAA